MIIDGADMKFETDQESIWLQFQGQYDTSPFLTGTPSVTATDDGHRIRITNIPAICLFVLLLTGLSLFFPVNILQLSLIAGSIIFIGLLLARHNTIDMKESTGEIEFKKMSLFDTSLNTLEADGLSLVIDINTAPKNIRLTGKLHMTIQHAKHSGRILIATSDGMLQLENIVKPFASFLNNDIIDRSNHHITDSSGQDFSVSKSAFNKNGSPMRTRFLALSEPNSAEISKTPLFKFVLSLPSIILAIFFLLVAGGGHLFGAIFIFCLLFTASTIWVYSYQAKMIFDRTEGLISGMGLAIDGLRKYPVDINNVLAVQLCIRSGSGNASYRVGQLVLVLKNENDVCRELLMCHTAIDSIVDDGIQLAEFLDVDLLDSGNLISESQEGDLSD